MSEEIAQATRVLHLHIEPSEHVATSFAPYVAVLVVPDQIRQLEQLALATKRLRDVAREMAN
ncbi:MAG: hypothetical protein OXG08_06560 [Gammaproteobacteria bacterium]|nr:hypothetical protein [Gammaproteobacteria bacterium]